MGAYFARLNHATDGPHEKMNMACLFYDKIRRVYSKAEQDSG
jgi:hypothetical protein